MSCIQKKGSKKLSRSRNGCLECRKKRKSCDEAKPSCSRCQKQNTKCTYKVLAKFKEDLELKGAAFGREGIWHKNKIATNTNDLSKLASENHYLNSYKYPGRLYFVNVTTNDLTTFPRIFGSLYPDEDLFLLDDGSSNFALSYYLEHVSPIFNPIKSRDKDVLDFRSLIQYSHKGADHVFDMLLAIGSCYLARQNKEHWMPKAHNYKKLAMKKVKERLRNTQMSDMVYEMLLSSLLLCFFDLANDCNDDWSQHIIMVKWLLNNYNFEPTNEIDSKVLSFTSDFFGYQEAMGRTACRNVSIFNSDNWEEDNNLISWMGCSKKLVSTITDITDLSYERLSMDEQDFKILTKRIENSIDQQQSLAVITNVEEDCFLLGCECKVLATKLYFQCSLLNKSPRESGVCDMVNLLGQYLRHIVLDNGYTWSFLIWPTFIMATQIDPLNSESEELRALVLDILNYLELNTLGNVNKSREIILSIWNKRDLDTSSTKIAVAHKNDWELYIANKDLNISLA